jgi:mRNA interferase HigB
MNVLSPQAIRAFIERFPEAEQVMRIWYNDLRKLEPENFAQLKAHFPTVDAVRIAKYEVVVFIFDVGGNKYRVVTRLDFEHHIGFILLIFTHDEYTRWNRAGRPL